MITYVTGSILEPQIQNPNAIAIILHICNDVGKWGAGVSGVIGSRWPQAEKAFRSYVYPRLGAIQIVTISERLLIVNMFAQRGVGRRSKPIRYKALAHCLTTVNKAAKYFDGRGFDIEFHCPRFGASLSGGEWSKIECLILDIIDVNFPFFVYSPVEIEEH